MVVGLSASNPLISIIINLIIEPSDVKTDADWMHCEGPELAIPRYMSPTMLKRSPSTRQLRCTSLSARVQHLPSGTSIASAARCNVNFDGSFMFFYFFIPAT